MKRPLNRGLLAALTVASLCTATAEAVVAPKKEASLADKTYRADALYVPEVHQSLGQIPALAGGLQGELAIMGVQPEGGFFDTRTGRWESLILARPMIPGTGVGNALRWNDLGGRPADDSALQQAAWNAVRGFLTQYQGQLRVDLNELGTPRVGVYDGGNLIQIHAPRVVNGIAVRDSGLTAIINHGNLLLFGLQNWADVSAPASAGVNFDAARTVVSQHVSPIVATAASSGRLEYIPALNGGAYDFRLAWVVDTTVAGDMGSWQGLVDAVSGDLLAFEDQNLYASRRVVGGVFPVSNDGRGPEGTMQPGWPMPFANVTIGANTVFTNTGGSLGCANTGAGATTLSGTFMRMSDACGAINETAAANTDFDLSQVVGTDCAVPAGHSPGDTNSSRSGFYELNRIKEQARAYLPANAWLQAQLTSNMNISQTCNAFWNGSTVNFYRDSGSTCRNTGEIAAVFDHEWGHGLDNNGANPNIAAPGEAIADIHAVLRLNNSCVGRGFLKNSTCGGYGDACIGTTSTGCTGVRDSDFAQHRCNLPHGVGWILNGFAAGCASGTPNAAACPAQGSRGPCNRETHCEGQAMAEVAWDISARDLRAGPFNLDSNTALELTTRLFYLGAETVTSWFSCAAGCDTAGTCGCGATNGYLLVLAVDDDNGNLNDGTPHMTAIATAFARHQMACNTPAPINAGCSGGPTTAPTVTATATPAGDAVTLTWGAVTGATHYGVYRTEGVAQCDFGKVKVGDVTATTFTDTGLLSGRPYSYVVIPIGSNNACFGRASTCATATPSAVSCGAVVTVSPIALAVDAGGNGVLQPNSETSVSVSPTWRNTGASAVALTGALSNFTGPAGGTYTINDATADYGTIPASTNQGCGANCYAVTVTAATRPTQHWDTGALETVNPSATTKAWVLHVGDTFTDELAANPFYRFVETVVHKGITGGCTATTYCGPSSTTREQMAVFVLVAKNGPAYNPPACAPPNLFVDVPDTSPFCKYIEDLANQGISGGCQPGFYCPQDAVTREQMAVFVLRTLDPTLNPPACTTPMFGDVPASSAFCKWIEELARRGVVTGCQQSPPLYCPTQAVTREQMSVFLAATFGLTLYGL